MARSVRWPWDLIILILSLPREHGVGASAASPPPGDSCNSHASSATGKFAVEILGGLLSGVIFVGALHRLAAEVAPPLRFFICHTGGKKQEGKNFPERLYDEMKRSWKLKLFITVFFDRKDLQDGLPFAEQILKEIERTQVGIVVVTPEFFTRKWPMVELVNIVESFERSSNMRRVLPLFYKMTVNQVRDNLRRGVWEECWTKMSTGSYPLSVERCRHAVERLCDFSGVNYIGRDLDCGRDGEYTREILKRVGKIVCKEIWKNIRARNLVNSSWRGHAPDRRIVGTLSTVSTTPSSQDLSLLDEVDNEDDIEHDNVDGNEDDRQIASVSTLSEERQIATVSTLSEERQISTVSTLSEERQIATVSTLSEERQIATVSTLSEETQIATVSTLSEETQIATVSTLSEERQIATVSTLSKECLEHIDNEVNRLVERKCMKMLKMLCELLLVSVGGGLVLVMVATRRKQNKGDYDGTSFSAHSQSKMLLFVPRTNQSIPTFEDASADHQRLADRLLSYAFTEQKIKGDGNCQFRALACQLYNCTPEHHKYVRKVVVKQLKAYPEVYAKYVPMEYSEYLKSMAKDAEWGDHVTLQAASDLFGVRIHLLTSLRDTWFKIVPADQTPIGDIYLSFWAEVHYDSIYRR